MADKSKLEKIAAAKKRVSIQICSIFIQQVTKTRIQNVTICLVTRQTPYKYMQLLNCVNTYNIL